MNADHYAQCAQLAMLLELSAGPKPGNVDRCHDHPEMGFRHFLASAVSAYPVFRKAAASQAGIGSLILEAVEGWRRFGLSCNTHFGEVTLLIPLTMAAGQEGDLMDALLRVLEGSTVEDAIRFYEAFQLSGARVARVDQLSLADRSAEEEIRRRELSLIDLMRLSKGHDLIAREWSNGFARSFQLSALLRERVAELGPNDGLVLTFLEALAGHEDSLIQAKHGLDKAREVSKRAKAALCGDDPIQLARELDSAFLKEGINPGSTADIMAASLFIALLDGCFEVIL